MKRRLLELSLWALAIGVPLAFWQLRDFHTGEKLLLLDEEVVATMLAQIFFFYVSPSIPFILLACLCRRRGPNGILKHPISSLIGATIGALAAVGTPYLLLRYSARWQGNIGGGILLMAIPICSLIMILLGWGIGRDFEKVNKPRNNGD